MEKCEFLGLNCNSSNQGGACYVEISGDRNCLFEDCNFTKCFGNTTGTGNLGGAIYAVNNGSDYIGTLKLKNCTFDLCSGREGGAIYLRSFFVSHLFIYFFLLLMIFRSAIRI
jgi:hypothetical protein